MQFLWIINEITWSSYRLVSERSEGFFRSIFFFTNKLQFHSGWRPTYYHLQSLNALISLYTYFKLNFRLPDWYLKMTCRIFCSGTLKQSSAASWLCLHWKCWELLAHHIPGMLTNDPSTSKQLLRFQRPSKTPQIPQHSFHSSHSIFQVSFWKISLGLITHPMFSSFDHRGCIPLQLCFFAFFLFFKKRSSLLALIIDQVTSV